MTPLRASSRARKPAKPSAEAIRANLEEETAGEPLTEPRLLVELFGLTKTLGAPSPTSRL